MVTEIGPIKRHPAPKELHRTVGQVGKKAGRVVARFALRVTHHSTAHYLPLNGPLLNNSTTYNAQLRRPPHLAVEAVDLVHVLALVVASRQVHGPRVRALPAQQRQDDLQREGAAVHKVAVELVVLVSGYDWL